MTPSLLPIVVALLALGLGAVIGGRGRLRLANVSFALAMTGLAAMEVGHALLSWPPGKPAGATVSGVAELVTLPAWTVFAVTFGARDAWAHLRRWWWAVASTTGAAMGCLAVAAVEPMIRPEIRDNSAVLLLTPFGKAAAILALLTTVFVLFQLESALRNSSGSARRRIKYFVLALFGLFGGDVFELSRRILYGQVLVGGVAVDSMLTLLALVVMGFSVARHRLLEVDVFISRQAVSSFVAVGVVGVYLLGLGLTSEVLVLLGIAPGLLVTAPMVLVSAMALVAALLSERIRARINRMVSTHFYRSKYDYRWEWTEFTKHLSRADSPALIAERVLEKAAQTLGSTGGVLWLCDAAGYWRLAASVEPTTEFLRLDPAALIRGLSNGRPAPLPLAGKHGGRMVPLEADGEISGLLAIGPPPGGKPTVEDEDLLATFATQAASVLSNARLSEELARARELEAVHRVSTFVMHDLKNCVAMLSLTSQNAQKHWRSPEFQKEAFRTIGESVRQMQELIGRLSSPMGQCGVPIRPCPLNKLIEEMVARSRVQPGRVVDIRTDLDSAAETVTVAEETIQTIVSNLLLNAVEAIGDEGRIDVKTSREGQWVTLAVTDTGCGMSEEFVRNELFLPFRTTKAKGLGVGLYQVKSLVDGAGGRIRVESRAGGGTTFWVDLPAERNPR